MITVATKKMVDTYRENGFDTISYKSKSLELIPRLYFFYNKHNTDESYIENIEDNVISNHKYLKIFDNSDDFFEIYGYINSESLSKEELSKIIYNIDYDLSLALSGQSNKEIGSLRSSLIQNKIDLESKINIILLTEQVTNFDQKSNLKTYVTNYESSLSKVSYNILFGDDLSEIILDIDSPKLYVETGFLRLKNKNEYLIHGSEKSLITNIMAKSLKELFIKYGTKGLFSSNLRYYVKSAKIDNSIKNTILFEPDNFWYFNNGIIITCKDYYIENDTIRLIDFSIVNGGQTTNIIGNTEFEKDFPIVCKIIRNKFHKEDDNEEFLSRVAETSNTQKPISAIDLISNRIEQKKLKSQLNNAGIFLQVKRGEKVNKTIYTQKWQLAKNDELGQMIFSYIYQNPGIARNSKSKMLSNDKYYDKIFKNNYDSNVLITLQQFKVSYNEWRKDVVKKSEINNNELIGLAKNGFFFAISVVGLIVKLYYNKELFDMIKDKLNKLDIDYYDNLEVYISQNDIGLISFLNNPYTFSKTSKSNDIFNILFKDIIIQGYKKYKKDFPSQAYSNFTKINKNYYKYIVPEIINKFDNNYFDNLFGNLANKISDEERLNVKIDYKLGLFDELNNYVNKKYIEYNTRISKNEILTKSEITNIVFKKPRSINDLSIEIGLSKDKIDNFGLDIIDIVEKYIII